LVTNPRIFEHPESIGDAWRQVHAWLACDSAWIPQPTERHAELLGERECMAISQQMPIWPHWLWNTGLRYARQTVINGIEDFVTRPDLADRAGRTNSAASGGNCSIFSVRRPQ
jgi:hypothetical protein